MKIILLLAAGAAATLVAGCSETGRRGGGYERSRTVVIESDYDRRGRRDWDRREVRRERDGGYTRTYDRGWKPRRSRDEREYRY